MEKPFAITLDVGSSLANKTGSWRVERPVYVDRLPPCCDACPAGENVQQWLYHAEAGHYEQAWRALVRDNPLPAVMGRVCYHPCETVCNRVQVDEAVGINAVERFLGDEAIARGWKLETDAAPSGKRVLVVGAGPAGLSAAYHLTRLGHSVTIYEAGESAGGMMRFGIPRYRLPREILQAEIDRILALGVTLEVQPPRHRRGGHHGVRRVRRRLLGRRGRDRQAYLHPCRRLVSGFRCRVTPAEHGGRGAPSPRPAGGDLRRRGHRHGRGAHRPAPGRHRCRGRLPALTRPDARPRRRG